VRETRVTKPRGPYQAQDQARHGASPVPVHRIWRTLMEDEDDSDFSASDPDHNFNAISKSNISDMEIIPYDEVRELSLRST
jgi:hypothetical protein